MVYKKVIQRCKGEWVLIEKVVIATTVWGRKIVGAYNNTVKH